MRAISIAAVTLAALRLVSGDHAGHMHGAPATPAATPATPASQTTTQPSMSNMPGMSGEHAGHGDSGSHAMPAASMTDTAMPPCVKNPSASSCEDYMYPETKAVEDLMMNCDMMGWMIGCGIWEACEAGELDSPHCQPFVLLATICKSDPDMAGMMGCASYNKLCGAGSVVRQCTEQGPVPEAVGSNQSQEMIVSACLDHSMPGCETCTGTGDACPNTLASLSTVCHAHHMEQCSSFYAMCDASEGNLDAFCDSASSGNSYDPPMRMYFHTGIRDIYLWRTLVPENRGQYAGIFLATMLAGVLATALRLLRNGWDTHSRLVRSRAVRSTPENVAEQKLLAPSAFASPAHAGRSVLSFVVIVLDYALMLLAMTFNVGIFFAVCLGLALGYFLLSPILQRYTERMQAQEVLTAKRCDCASSLPLETTKSGRDGSDGVCCDTKTAHAVNDASDPQADPLPSCCS